MSSLLDPRRKQKRIETSGDPPSKNVSTTTGKPTCNSQVLAWSHPTSFVNIPEVIQLLRDKLQKFEQEAADIKAARHKESEVAESEQVPRITIEVPEVIQNTPAPAENDEEDTKTDRQKLTLDLGMKIVPEIRVNEDAIIIETQELKVENNGDSLSPAEENKAILCDKPGAENGLTLLPHSPLTNSNEGSFSPSCTLMKNLIIN